MKKLNYPDFKCEACGEISKSYHGERGLCEDCREDMEDNLDVLNLNDINRRRGIEWVIKNIKS